MKYFDFIFRFAFKVSYDSDFNAYFPVTGEYIHNFLHFLLQRVDPALPQTIREKKLPLPVKGLWLKDKFYLDCINNKIGNKLMELFESEELSYTLQVGEGHTKMTLQLFKVELIRPAEFLEKVMQQKEIGIKILTPVLKPVKSEVEFLRYIALSVSHKLKRLKVSLPSKCMPDKDLTYEPTYVRLTQKLFSPHGKQSYPGILGSIRLKGSDFMRVMYGLGNFLAPGVKTSYGFGWVKVAGFR